MNKKKPPSQMEILREFFIDNPNRDIKHPEVVDWVTENWKKRTNKVFRDPDRGIRKLYQEGFLIKVSKGNYRYDPKRVVSKKSEEFSSSQKDKILKRDNYQCIICGKGKREGEELHVDHIIPREKGGKATIENGQTLCSQHNIFKDNFSQTEFSKRLFVKWYKRAKDIENQVMIDFCNDILKVYEKHKIDDHIDWDK